MPWKVKNFFFSLLILGNIFALQILLPISSPACLKTVFLDVGQGDSIFIELPSKNLLGKKLQILIDGGPNPWTSEKISKLMPFFDRKIDLLILTHPHQDHLNGLFEVVNDWEIGKAILVNFLPNDFKEKESYLNFKNLLQKNHIETLFVKRGDKINLDNLAHLFILWPEENFESENTDENGIVLKLSFGEIDFLFCADIPQKIERLLLAKEISLKNEKFSLESEILKIAHHGSKTSSSKEFLEIVRPQVAIISVGKDNPFGHPHLEVLKRLEEMNIISFRTDLFGSIEVLSDGKGYQIRKLKI
jgi:competence protein ComEC